jgi:H+/Cl- antiporter ClcA
LLRVPAWQRVVLIAGGAGGGIAATFNTPVGGVLFALEMMMHEISVRTLVPVALATAAGTYIGRHRASQPMANVIASSYGNCSANGRHIRDQQCAQLFGHRFQL